MIDHDDYMEDDVSALRQKIRELTWQVDVFTARKHRRQRVTAILGALLSVTVAFGLSGLTSMTAKLDAEAVAQISRQQLEQRLPAARMQAQAYLAAEAPRIVANTLRAAMARLPELRKLMFRSLTDSFDELNHRFELKAVEVMAQFINDAKASIDDRYPDLPDRQKVELLIEGAAEQFREVIREGAAAMYPDYKREMGQVISHLDMLRHSRESELTPEQRLHKQIIETLLQLLERRQGELRETGR